jgi:hypothetical protein
MSTRETLIYSACQKLRRLLTELAPGDVRLDQDDLYADCEEIVTLIVEAAEAPETSEAAP